MGYKQELKRSFSTLQVFGISFSIMGLLPSIATVLGTGITGGPVSLIWGWLLGGIFIMTIGIGMSELASSYPTSGGLYFWTFHYAPMKYKVALSFFIGITNSLALTAALCSITYGLAENILACVAVAVGDSFTITNGITYGVFAACVILQTGVTCLASSAVSRLQSLSIYVNVFLVILFLIVLPIGTHNTRGEFNDAKYIFGDFENFSDWSNGWTFFQYGFGSVVWTVGAFDSAVHMCEEATDPTKAVPIGICMSIGVCVVIGFIINIVIAACMIPDIDAILNSSTGQPLAQIFLDLLGKRWTIAFMSLIAVGQFLMGASTLTAISRQVWAFARDDGLPFSGFIKVVNKRLQVPIRSIIFSSIVALILGLLCLIGTTAANALFSLSIMGNYMSWVAPQILRFCCPKSANFEPGKFYLGKIWSPIVNWISIIFQLFIIVMVCLPDNKAVDPNTMNYTIVVNGGTWILSMAYFYLYKHKTYSGPKSNLDDDDVLTGTEVELSNVTDAKMLSSKGQSG
ncbi:hypothetical protein WICANDRAFT_85051 [Wickerhamomyces anomalus NRRL Y-366-8]|uniref:Amino acid permease/ SLC12A domain-containing protein n=1 Tax=Wickerhamomyces anomalus (strain ATCC 58044 / CBS 1984 / NCYC 433 / NRRL Y-366-8) TaxID=683960 RepID=A0A1E3NXD1_WICAA|nr:uncharacterized protein WICANDRAFT_85051 [Wickerhamomyces anomalus NRRL Y-366-8]ODQ57851.1 hypothetical protein WICANDRAFT_85051 [Wickerhamomyces anomalus NRRL Y-366-8]